MAAGLAVPVAPAAGDPNWWLVARCEEAGDWDTRGPEYSGGLGFFNATWSLWAARLGLERRFPNAADAPPAVQIRVAEYGWRHGGYWGSLWNGCASSDGGR